MSAERPKADVATGPAHRPCVSRGRRVALLLSGALPLLLGACGFDPAGDFGRPRDLSVQSTVTEAFRLAAQVTRNPVYGSEFPMTPDEVKMRETAYRLRVQIQNLRPIRWVRYSEVSYADYLENGGYTYGASRLSLIHEELKADEQTLNRFGEFGRRVLTADQRRMDALIEDGPYYSRSDRRNARSRIMQNCAFIEGTFEAIAQRIEAYQYAIDRARIETPEISEAVVEGSLNRFRDNTVMLQTELVAVCETMRLPRGSARKAARKLYGRSERIKIREKVRVREETEVYKPAVPDKISPKKPRYK